MCSEVNMGVWFLLPAGRELDQLLWKDAVEIWCRIIFSLLQFPFFSVKSNYYFEAVLPSFKPPGIFSTELCYLVYYLFICLAIFKNNWENPDPFTNLKIIWCNFVKKEEKRKRKKRKRKLILEQNFNVSLEKKRFWKEWKWGSVMGIDFFKVHHGVYSRVPMAVRGKKIQRYLVLHYYWLWRC